MSATGDLRGHIGDRPNLLAAFMAALWARVGRKVTVTELAWASGLGIPNAPGLVLEGLRESGAIVDGCLDASGMAKFACDIIMALSHGPPYQERIVFTLPEEHPLSEEYGKTLYDQFQALILGASRTITIVSPYIEENGIGLVYGSLQLALRRGVRVTIVSHDIGDLASLGSRALEPLRREAVGLPGLLQVFSATSPSTASRSIHPLLHGKLLISDSTRVLISSANLTLYGLTTNFEVGVELNGPEAHMVEGIVIGLLDTPLVNRVFNSHLEIP